MTERQFETRLDAVLRIACETMEVSRKHVKSSKRTKQIARARQLAIWLMLRHSHVSTPVVGRMFNRDHSTVVHSKQVVEGWDGALGEQRDEADAKLAKIFLGRGILLDTPPSGRDREAAGLARTGGAAMKANGAMAVMADRKSGSDALDYFPTPPWATRALCDLLTRRGHDLPTQVAWEPAAGAGHMVGPLRECFEQVHASDVAEYGARHERGSFVGDGPDVVQAPLRIDWIITNPPFKLGADFALRGIAEARVGAAMLVRTAWLEGGERFATVFAPHPPSCVALFSERVPMINGRWDPKASTATSYAWVIWERALARGVPQLVWFPPGTRKHFTKPDDAARYAGLGVQIDGDEG